MDYKYFCDDCNTEIIASFRMGQAAASVKCECGSRASRDFSGISFSTRGDDLDKEGKPVYCPGLARRMPFGKQDPKAYFKSKDKAREAAKRKADTGDYELTLD